MRPLQIHDTIALYISLTHYRNGRLPDKLLFGEVKGPCPQGCSLGLHSIMLRFVSVKNVLSTDVIGMIKTDRSGQGKTAMHIP